VTGLTNRYFGRCKMAFISKLEKLTKNYQSGMVKGWNKFCFTGGIVEVSAKLPGQLGNEPAVVLHMLSFQGSPYVEQVVKPFEFLSIFFLRRDHHASLPVILLNLNTMRCWQNGLLPPSPLLPPSLSLVSHS
jgi:hypothetical protein